MPGRLDFHVGDRALTGNCEKEMKNTHLQKACAMVFSCFVRVSYTEDHYDESQKENIEDYF